MTPTNSSQAPPREAPEEVVLDMPRWVPRWVVDAPASLVEAVELARRGHYTAAGENAPARLPHLAWVWVVFLPVRAVCAFAMWSVEGGPGRGLAVWFFVVMPAATLAQLVPAAAWAVPAWATYPGLWAVVAGWAA